MPGLGVPAVGGGYGVTRQPADRRKAADVLFRAEVHLVKGLRRLVPWWRAHPAATEVP